MLRILSIDNLSGAPYRLATPDFDHSLRLETPTRIHDLVAGGHFDAALLPVASLPALGGGVAPLGEYGIACRGPVQSVQLFSSLPLEALLRDGLPVYATPKSRTSVELLRVLCRRVYGVSPALTFLYPRAAAHLLIGDAAYEFAHTHGGEDFNVDLGGWWLSHTGLPFVFARWVVSPSLGGRDRARLAEWLERCADRAESPAGLAEMAACEADPGAAAARHFYYERLRARLDEEALAGLDLFLELMESTRHEYSARIA